MLAIKMLLRNWRGGSLALIFWSLALAVSVVTSVGLLAERVERALVAESSSFLAADQVVETRQAIDPAWLAEAKNLGVETARTLMFPSMVFHEDAMHLAAVKAVDSNYPLRGAIKYSETPFATDPEQMEISEDGPPPGEVWVDPRLLPLLAIEIGDTLDVGEVTLRVGQTLVEEPDRGDSYSFIGARVMMNWQDLDASGVVQPGSRVRYRLLLAGQQNEVSDYMSWLGPQLNDSHRVITPDQAQASIADTMERGRRFLLLAGSIGVVLAGIALALASRHFASGQTTQVALLKSWGVSARQVRSLYWQQAFWLGIAGSLVGMILGYLFHEALLGVLADWLPIDLPQAGARAWITGLATGMLCLVGFTLPAIWHLPAQSPLAVIRQDVSGSAVSALARSLVGVVAVVALLFWYSGNISLSLAILLGFAATAAASLSVGYLLLRLGKSYGHWVGSIWRLALSNLWRRRGQSLVQMVGFSGAITLLLIMAVIRTSLIDEWRWQLADDAPNHFLVNVAPFQMDGVEKIVEQRGLNTEGWFGMVGGRITHINGEPPAERLKERHETLNREVNISWTDNLPADNQIAAGQWWDKSSSFMKDFRAQYGEEVVPLSIEAELADELGLKLGDSMRFSIGGLGFESIFINSRELNWDNMNPNFYFLFPEGYLEEFPRTHITSVYIPPSEKLLVNDLLKQYPTIQVLELDKIIERIRTIITQVTMGLEMMTLLILACGVLVMFAAVSLSMGDRLQEKCHP